MVQVSAYADFTLKITTGGSYKRKGRICRTLRTRADVLEHLRRGEDNLEDLKRIRTRILTDET